MSGGSISETELRDPIFGLAAQFNLAPIWMSRAVRARLTGILVFGYVFVELVEPRGM